MISGDTLDGGPHVTKSQGSQIRLSFHPWQLTCPHHKVEFLYTGYYEIKIYFLLCFQYFETKNTRGILS